MGPGLRHVPFAVLLLGTALEGCGGGYSSPVQPPPPSPDFSLSLSATKVSVPQGGTAQPITVSATGSNGFSGTVQITLGGLPSGVVTDPVTPFLVAVGGNQPVVFGATSGVAPGAFDVQVQGASANLSHSASLQLAVEASGPPPPALPRTTYARTDSVPASDDPPGEPRRRRIVYDAVRKKVFVANRAMNRIEVFSSTDQSRVGQVAIPAPTSVDLSADGATLWVGSEVEQIAAVDPAALTVTARFPVDGVLIRIPNAPLLFSIPVEVAALANGKLLVRLRRRDAAISILALWDPSANTWTDLTQRAPEVFPPEGAGVMARSGDHTRVVVAANDASGFVAVFDASGNVAVPPVTLGAGSIPLVAANTDGSRVAVFLAEGFNSILFLLNANLQVVDGRGSGRLHGMAFSPDASHLYVSENDDLPPVLSVLDGQTLRLLGQASDLRLGGLRSEMEAADETGLLFGVINRGVSFLDTAPAGPLNVAAPVFTGAPAVLPSEGPAVGGTTSTLQGQNFHAGATVAFGGQQASSVNVAGATQIQATSPPNAAKGAVNIAAYFPSGWLALAPDGFSYGPQILEVSPNAAPKGGSGEVQILGYGFGGDAAKVSVTIAGSAATVKQVENLPSLGPSLGLDSSYPFPLQRITIQTPSGTPGKADVKVTSPAGTATAKKAVQFLQDARTITRAGFFKFIAYDQGRKRVYVTATDRIEVFDTVSEQFLTALTPPGGPPPSAALRGMGLTADGAQLVVADFGARNLYLLNPDVVGSGNTVSVRGVTGFPISGPARVAATSTGKVFVGMSVESAGACAECLAQLDIQTQTMGKVPQAELSTLTLTSAPLVQSAAQGERVFLAFGAPPGGPVAVWNAATSRFDSTVGISTAADLAAAADGTNSATLSASCPDEDLMVWNSDLKLASRPGVSERQGVPGAAFVPGLTLHPSGALLYRPFLTAPPGSAEVRGGVDILSARTGTLKLRVFLPEPLLTEADALHGSFLTTDEWGKKIFALTTSGLTVVELASVPVGIGTVSPASGPAAGGTLVRIRGSGLQSGAQVTVGGAAATNVIFLDADTLEFTTPGMSAGPQRIVVTNSDGESDALDAAFTAN